MLRDHDKTLIPLILSFILLLTSCSLINQDQPSISDLPDPCDYVISVQDLPSMKEAWTQIRADSQQDAIPKTCRVGFRSGSVPATEDIIQAIVEGTLKVIFVENALLLYDQLYSTELVKPTSELEGQATDWVSQPLNTTYGDQSKLWRTEIGEEEYLKMPTYYLEFSKDHVLSYIMVSTMGFNEEEAQEIVMDLAEITAEQIPIIE